MTLITKGQVLSGDCVVADIYNDLVIVKNAARCPLFLLDHSDVKLWLANRTMDLTRGHSRSLRRIKGLLSKDEAAIALSVHGVTVSDNYWIKQAHETLSYQDVVFKDNDSFLVAFAGDVTGIEANNNPSPQLTLGGSLEKGWTLSDSGEWVLYKRENPIEVFNELFCAYASRYFGIETAEYERTDGGIKTRNFASSANFEDATALFGEDCSDYAHSYDVILSYFGKDAANEYVKLLFFDAVVKNTDRHPGNFGFLRDRETGKFLSLSPNFDYNQTLFGNTVVRKTPNVSDILITDFLKLIDSKTCGFRLPEFNIGEFTKNAPLELTSDKTVPFELAASLVNNRYELLTEHLVFTHSR